MLTDNPVMKKLVETGEERIGKIVQTLISNERFMAMVQNTLTQAVHAKGVIDQGVQTALRAMHVPSAESLRDLETRLSEIEERLSAVESKQHGDKPAGGKHKAKKPNA